MPQVTVILPVFNAARYVRQSVQSVLAQTFSDFELIVINDGCTDGSGQLLEDLAGRDSRIRLLRQENKGYAASLNTALQLAQGELMARMDADDISLPDRFRKQVEYLRERPWFGAVGSRVYQMDPEGSPVCQWYFQEHHDEIDQCHMGFRGSAIAHPSVMIRTSLLREIGGYRTRFEPAEDVDLWLRLAERSRLANIPEVLLRYRLHGQSVSHARRGQQRRNMMRAVQDAAVRRGLCVTPGDFRADSGTGPPPRIQWARMALDAGEYANARRLAAKAVAHHPGRSEAWRKLAAALIGKRSRSLAIAWRNLADRGASGPAVRSIHS